MSEQVLQQPYRNSVVVVLQIHQHFFSKNNIFLSQRHIKDNNDKN